MIFRKEKLTIKKIIACLLGFAGIVCVNLNGLDFTMDFTGDCKVTPLNLVITLILICTGIIMLNYKNEK